MEREVAAEAILLDYVCDVCGNGIMERHGKVAYMTDPIQLPHKCNNTHCGFESIYFKAYPEIVFRRKE